MINLFIFQYFILIENGRVNRYEIDNEILKVQEWKYIERSRE